MKIEVSSGNVFEDLGLPDSDELLVKAKLLSRICDVIKQKRLTQAQAARILGIDQPKISMILKGRLYPHRPETLNLDRAKTTGIDDRKEVNISNIELFAIVDSREFSRRSKSMFQADGGISGFSTDRLIRFLNALQCDVEIRVHRPKTSVRRKLRRGRTAVIVE